MKSEIGKNKNKKVK